MKTLKAAILALAALSVILAAAAGSAARQAGEQPEVLLERAIQLETVDGDLEAAIGLYKKIVGATASSRAVAAKALLRLGGCYEKLGLEEARKAYERLVREFADQPEQALAARGRLEALGKPAEAGGETGFSVKTVWADADGVFTHSPSPDGKFMTFSDYSESGDLGIRDLGTGKSRLLTSEGTWEQPQQMAYSSKWSPDGKRIAYCWQHGSWAELRVLDVDDPKPRVLYGDEAGDTWVSPEDWSPDGRHILISIARSDGPELALVPAQGGSPRILKKFEPRTISSGSGGEKQFSPDGHHIVYDRTPGQGAATDIFVLDLAAGRETPLVRHPADDRVFGWSPDGGWVLFASDRSGTLGLWAIRVADGQPQGEAIAVNPSVGRIAPLGFTQDGSFYYADVKAARDVFETRIDFETGQVLAPPRKAVERYEGSNMNPRYSPDGKALAYVSRRGSMVYPTNRANALCIQSLETGGERVFMDEFANLGIRALAGPRWSSDGRSIAVAGWRETGGPRNGIYLAELETGRVTILHETPPDVRLRNHEFSRDGRLHFHIQADTKEGISQILARDLKNGQEREIHRASGANSLRGLAASPDGKWLATISNRRELALIPTGGGPARVAHRFDQDIFSAPEWLPDGRSIIVGGQSPNELEKTTLFVVPVDGGKTLEIVLPLWLWDRPTVHPDGQRVAWACVVNPDTAADVWVMRNFLK
jgi:Tol biopolymer transport system component